MCENTLVRDCDSINVSQKAPPGLQVVACRFNFAELRKIFLRASQILRFYTWGNSGIEPYSGSGNQLSSKRGSPHGPCCHGELQWSTMLDWTYR
jgi:hypothetical protein